MKRKEIVVIVVAILSSLMLYGCGTPLYELTTEEEDIIVQTSAEILSKYNIRQTDGMNWVKLEETQEESMTEEETSTEKDTEKPNNPDVPNNNPEGDDGNLTETTLQQAIGYADRLSFELDACKVVDYYSPAEGFVVNSSEGKKLVLITFTMKNISDGDVNLDMINSKVSFSLGIKGEAFVPEKQSLVSFTQRVTTVKKNKSEKVIFIFDVDEGLTGAISEVTFKVNNDGKLYSVKL